MRSDRPWRRHPSNFGGVVLEYLLVTLFTAIASVTLLGVAAHIFEDKIASFAERAGIKLDRISWNPFANSSGEQ